MHCGENLISSARSCGDRFRPVTLSVANVKSPCLRKNNSPFLTILGYDGTLGKRNYTVERTALFWSKSRIFRVLPRMSALPYTTLGKFCDVMNRFLLFPVSLAYCSLKHTSFNNNVLTPAGT